MCMLASQQAAPERCACEYPGLTTRSILPGGYPGRPQAGASRLFGNAVNVVGRAGQPVSASDEAKPTPFSVGQSAPDAEVLIVGERELQALGFDQTPSADVFGMERAPARGA